MKESFSQKTKTALAAIPIKKKCCRYLWDAVAAFPKDDTDAAERAMIQYGTTTISGYMQHRWANLSKVAR